MVPGHIRCVNVFLYKFQMSKEGFCVNSVEFQPLAGEFSSLNTHSQGSCCHLVRGCSLDGQLWSCLKYAQILEAENLQIQGKGFPCWTGLPLVQEENSASPVLASMGATGSLMISEALLPNGIFCCCLFWRTQFDEH